MSPAILLDAGPLGLLTNPRGSDIANACNLWMESILREGASVYVPEIADYEVRRELLRARKQKGLERLDALKSTIGYLPITTKVMLKAAEFWAEARRQGKPTADAKALDADVILAAQAVLMADQKRQTVIATTNVGHLSRFTQAREWSEISL